MSYLRRHFKVSHEKSPKIFACSEESCGKKFRSEQFLKTHVLVVHLGEKPNSCTICEKKFARKYQLNDHLAEHTGEYRFKCEICQKGFAHFHKYNRHKAIHNKKKCDKCEKQFENWTDLVAHKRIEHQRTEFKCEICDKNFCTKISLKVHSGVHNSKDESEVHQCEFENCPKFYFHKKNLDSHIRSKHKGMKFPCTIDGCETNLSTKQKLDQHLKWHENSKNFDKKIKKVKKTPAKRKDAGIPISSAASILSGVEIPIKIQKMLKKDQGDEIEIVAEPMEIYASEIDSELEEDVPKIEQPVGLNFIDPTVIIPNDVKKKWFLDNKHLLIETK